MFGADNIKVATMPIVKDLASGTYPVFTAAHAVTIKSAHVIPVSTLAAGTANYYSLALQNLGTAGAGTVAVAASIGGTIAGGTSTGWAALTPKPFTIIPAAAKLAAGEVLGFVYAETGTADPTGAVIKIEYVDGVG